MDAIAVHFPIDAKYHHVVLMVVENNYHQYWMEVSIAGTISKSNSNHYSRSNNTTKVSQKSATISSSLS